MIEFFGGLAAGALVAGVVCCSWHVADRAERRSVQVPEPDVVPAAGQSWVLRDEEGASAVIVNAVVGERVLYAFPDWVERTLSIDDFIRLYRRV